MCSIVMRGVSEARSAADWCSFAAWLTLQCPGLVRELPYHAASEAQFPFSRSPNMLWTIAVILFILWLLGFVVLHVGGGLIHLLLVLAIIAVVWRLVTGRPAV
jgi:hypothetical protein